MKLILSVLALSFAFVSFAQAETRASCANKIKISKELAAIAEDYWKRGAGVDGIQVRQAKIAALNLELECRTITIDSYCTQALPLAKAVVDFTQELIKGGAAGYQDLLKAKLEAAAVEGNCL